MAVPILILRDGCLRKYLTDLRKSRLFMFFSVVFSEEQTRLIRLRRLRKTRRTTKLTKLRRLTKNNKKNWVRPRI